MAQPTESERLYVVETKLDTVLTAVERTNDKIDDLGSSLVKYATRAELEQAVIDGNLEIEELKKVDAILAKKHALNVWLTGTLSAAFGIGMTILIQMAFNK